MLKPETAGRLWTGSPSQHETCCKKDKPHQRQETCLRFGFVQTLHHAVAAAALLAQIFLQLPEASLRAGGTNKEGVKAASDPQTPHLRVHQDRGPGSAPFPPPHRVDVLRRAPKLVG